MKTILGFSFALLLPVLFSVASSIGESSIEDTIEEPKTEAVDEPLSPEQAAATMVVPDGFQVTLFAGEPDVQQPVGFCFDDRGRLWVAEAYNYPDHGTKPGDRIVILEDSDGDGKFDNRKVFFDQLNYVTGIEVGFGGAWVMSPPFFYFIPDKDGDDVPDSKPQLLLDGFGNHANSHNLANGFAWGPDGWLYGTHGRTNFSRIAKPGTPDDQRVQFDGGVYRYHPVKHIWEPYADGTTNPWGIDWNDVGDSFVTNCVNPHLFQIIQGAHYEPWRNRESSRYAYERISTIADHLHYLGGPNFHEGIGSDAEDAMGGGHAHCGTMIYLGDNWPDSYRNSVFTNNIHGKRVNNDLLARSGSGYIASHGKDLMKSKDPWHMGVTVQYGPDGGVYVSDWSDTGECHSIKNTQRETGRIFKVTFGTPAYQSVDIASLSNDELVQKQLHKNDWHVRHARRVLQERAARGDDMSDVRKSLLQLFDASQDIPRKLRAVWALYVIGGIDESFLLKQLNHESEYIRGWSIRLLCEGPVLSTAAMNRFIAMADKDPSAYVRLQLSSSMQRWKLEDRWSVAAKLLQHTEDASDMNLPLMNWYAIEPLVDHDLKRFVELATEARIPLVRNHIARRVASHKDSLRGINLLSESLFKATDAGLQHDLLSGMLLGLEGRRSVGMPAEWTVAYTKLESSLDAKVRQSATELALVFDDPRALVSLSKLAADRSANPKERARAICSLVAKKGPNVASLVVELVRDTEVRREAIRGLAEFDHESTSQLLLDSYSTFDADAKQDALQTLASRSSWGASLLDAVETNRIPRKDISAFTARQLQSLGNQLLNERIAKLWGEMRTTSADKKQLIGKYRKLLTPALIEKANVPAGRALFQKHCTNCHKLFGEGGAIGPDITGAQRTNIDYVLENLVDPSSAVAKDFQMELIRTESGRVITGMIVDESDSAITIQTTNEKVVLPKSEIEERSLSKVSMMPDGLLQTLTNDQIRDLIGYLGSPMQVDLPSP
ncbi:MAG: c-type cytochrome [Planctomycetota bacterium]|nr:c-type cytochrome [Planctomycetota bacterium]